MQGRSPLHKKWSISNSMAGRYFLIDQRIQRPSIRGRDVPTTAEIDAVLDYLGRP